MQELLMSNISINFFTDFSSVHKSSYRKEGKRACITIRGK
jgi:hypothetical protein